MSASKPRRLRAAVAASLLAVGLVVAVDAQPAFAESTGDYYGGNAFQVDIHLASSTGGAPWTDVVGGAALGETVYGEIKHPLLDVWLPTTYTQYGVAWQCSGSGQGSSGLIWFDNGRSDFSWGNLVDAGYVLAAAITCAHAGETIDWAGLIVRTWVLGNDPGNEFTVLLGTGTRGTCALPSSAEGGATRSCINSSGGTSAVWYVGGGTTVSGSTYNWFDVGFDFTDVCDTSLVTVGTRRMSPVVFTVDSGTPATNGTFGYPFSGTYGYQGQGFAGNISSDVSAEVPAGTGFTAYYGAASGVFRLGVESSVGYPAGVVDRWAMYGNTSGGNPAGGRAAAAGTFPTGALVGVGPITVGGYGVAHNIRAWCLKRSASPAAGAYVRGSSSGQTCPQSGLTANNGGQGQFMVTTCWDLVGQFVANGSTSAGSVGNPAAGDPAESTCTSVAIECVLQNFANGAKQFFDSLTDLPATISELLQRLFIPTTYSLDMVKGLRDDVMARPPASVVATVIGALTVIGPSLVADSCDAPSFTLPWGTFTFPTRCTVLGDAPAFNVAYQLVSAGMWLSLLLSLWAIARDAMRK